MEVVGNNYMPGDSRLVQQIVYELKSQGIFDQFRKECIADVDTKPAYQNLRQRVEGSVSSFLNEKVWSPDMNKNQVREQLRKSIHESGYLDIGVERIVDQVVNPKINSIFLPQVEDVVYRYLGVQKPMREIKKDLKIDIEDLLPTDLEAVSPESVHSDKNDSKMEVTSELDNSFNKQIDDDESPPFEPLDNVPTLVTTLEENSVDSHLSGFSGLQSHDNSNQESDTKICQMDISSQDSQTSQNSSESHLSIVTSDETMMEVGDDSRSKLIKSKEAELKTTSSYNTQKPDNALTPDNMKTSNNMQTVDKAQTLDNIQFSEEIQIESKPSEQLKKIETVKNIDNTIKYLSEKKSDKKLHSRKSDEKKTDDKKSNDKKYESKKSDKHTDERRSDEKKSEKRDEKKSKSSDKYTSKDKKDDKYKKSSSKSKDREKSNSRHNSSSSKEKDSSTKDKDSSSLMKDKEQSSKDKTKIKEKKEYRSSSSTKEKGERERSKDKSDKDKSDKDKSDKDKNKFDKPRGRSDKDFKERSDKDKDKYDKKKEKYDKEKNKTSSSSGIKSSSSSSKDRSSSSSKKDKYRSSGSDSKDKVKSTNGDSKSSRSDIKSKGGDSKTSSSDVKSSNGESRSKSSEHSKTEEKQSLTSSSSKKSKKRDSKKQAKDDHYSSKDKKSDRRSTDRDSNDGQSNKQSHSNSLSESTSSSSQKQSNESSSISGSGTNDSGNSDRVEYIKMAETPTNNNEIQKLKYVKPKLASNFQEAIKIMKIRKQLAKLERKNQLSLARIDLLNPVPNGVAVDKPKVKENFTKDNHIYTNYSHKVDNIDVVETLEVESKSTDIEESTPIRVITPLKTTDLSKENWEALEARLAQEMSNVNYSSYESYDDYDYSGCEVIISPKKKADTNIGRLLIEETSSSNNNIVSNLTDKFEASLEAKHDIESKNNESPDIEVTEIQNTEIESSAQICNTRHNINSIKCDEVRIESNDMTIQSPHIPKNIEKSNGTHPQVLEIEEIGLVECIVPNQLEEHTISPSSRLVTELSLDIQDINEYIPSDSMCRYLEKPSPSVQRNLQFIYQFVKKLENDVEHCIKASQNNFLPIQRGKKRKCELYVDLKNNNSDFFEEITEVKKRGRPPRLHSNTSISKANKDKSRNSTDISPNERFSLPLSPAESDKSTDKKEDIKPEKQKANQVKTPKPKRQRYSSEDLYKPRPVIRRGRRNRCAKTSD